MGIGIGVKETKFAVEVATGQTPILKVDKNGEVELNPHVTLVEAKEGLVLMAKTIFAATEETKNG